MQSTVTIEQINGDKFNRQSDQTSNIVKTVLKTLCDNPKTNLEIRKL
jgi:hypothetical protein